jgi:hypothetical protein
MATDPALREQARAMRVDGATYDQIVGRLGVSKSSVSLWVRDLPHPERTPEGDARRLAGLRQQAASRRAAQARERESFVSSVSEGIGRLSERELLIAGAAVYWAEGSKRKPWRLLDRVVFINSDPSMIVFFMAFLRSLGIDRGMIRLRLQIHETADLVQAISFWAATLGWPEEDFQRVTLKRHVPTTRRRNTGDDYHGCLEVTVLKSRDLYRRIEGIWRAIADVGLR